MPQASSEKFALFLGFGLLYMLVFLLSHYLGLNNSYLPGISLLYLPAGVRLMACLVGDVWGAIGLVWGIWWMIPLIWPQQSSLFHFFYALVGASSTWVSVRLAKRWLQIDDDLHHLRLLHFPLLSLVAVVGHAICVNLYYYWTEVVALDQLGLRMTSQMLGNFLGSMIFLFALALVLFVQKRWFTPKK